MKLIHCADLHLDSRMTTRLTREKARERQNEILHTFVRMVAFAREQDVRGILIAGDLFDTYQVSETARRVVLDTMREYQDIYFFYLRGNHDMDFFADADSIPENLKCFQSSWTRYRLGNVVICGRELARGETDFSLPELSSGNYNIVMLHGQAVDASTGFGDGETIPLRLLKNGQIDYLALGHIHSFREGRLDARGVYCYPGCLEGRGFDECGPHGFVLLDIDRKRGCAKRTFVPFAERRLELLRVDVTGCTSDRERLEQIRATVDMEQYRNCLVRIILEGMLDAECGTDITYIRKELESSFYYVEVMDETGITVDADKYRYDVSLKGEFVRQVQASGLPEETKRAVIRMGLQTLTGGEVQICD